MVSPVRRPLYRRVRRFVILSLLLAVVPATGQSPRKKAAKGPRALGLLQLSPSGKASLIPIVILDDGKYYDAGSYKATPVPMALEVGTVYEGIRTGNSQGLFTVSGALQGNKTWTGVGTWEAAGMVKPKKVSVPSKPADDVDKPPVLHRPGTEKAPAPTPAPAAPPKAETPAPAPVSSEPSPPPVDKDAPVLRRGRPKPAEHASVDDTPSISAIGSISVGKAGGMQLVPAISDASGPEPRSFTYEMKPEEEQAFRKKILALATGEAAARAKLLISESAEPAPATASPKGRSAKVAKAPQPSLDDVQLRVFDLTTSNEPILVLTATAKVTDSKASELHLYVTMVARNDIYGELHKLFSNITDTRHLDVTPRMELIDAVDVDGDERAELLFRETTDAGSVFGIYRVLSDRLYPLFQGTPGE